MSPRSRGGPGLCAQFACLLEAGARKAGNVHRERDFADASFLDFVRSAAAIAAPLELAAARPLGETILSAIEATRAVAPSNTNLGLVLLLAPLASVHHAPDLRAALAARLAATSHRDAELVYQAIRLARPSGMGKVEREDLAETPRCTLREAMALAEDRDRVARQYSRGFEDVFAAGLPSLADARAAGLGLEDSIRRCHLELLARFPDSLIARKCGSAEAEEASARAGDVLAAGWPASAEARRLHRELDEWLCAGGGHRRNPGTTADLVAASLYLAIRNGMISLSPLSS